MQSIQQRQLSAPWTFPRWSWRLTPKCLPWPHSPHLPEPDFWCTDDDTGAEFWPSPDDVRRDELIQLRARLKRIEDKNGPVSVVDLLREANRQIDHALREISG